MRKIHYLVIVAVVSFITVFHASSLLAATTHKVKAGDTLFLLSKKYGVAITSIKMENGLRSNTLMIGQQLRIPSGNTSRSSINSNFSQDDVNWLAKTVYSEARGEPYEGQVAVAAVVLNRLQSGNFPNTIRGIVFEPLAFSAVADGQIYMTPNPLAVQAAKDALAGWDPSGGALYYWNPAKATSKWIWSRPIIKRIGNHVFAR